MFQGLLCSVCLGLFAGDLAFAHNERVAFESLEMRMPGHIDEGREVAVEWSGLQEFLRLPAVAIGVGHSNVT